MGPGGRADGDFDAALGVEGPGTPIGTVRYLQPADGEMALRWLDGTDTGLRIQASHVSLASRAAYVHWRSQATPHAPRLDALLLAGFPDQEWPRAVAGTQVAADGRFGGQEAYMARLVARDGRRLPLSVASSSPARLILGIPAETPPGRYQVAVGPASAINTWSTNTLSNLLRLEITRPQPSVAGRDTLIDNLHRSLERQGIVLAGKEPLDPMAAGGRPGSHRRPHGQVSLHFHGSGRLRRGAISLLGAACAGRRPAARCAVPVRDADVPPSDTAALQAIIRSQASAPHSRDTLVDQLRAPLAALKRARFGASSEKLDRSIPPLEPPSCTA